VIAFVYGFFFLEEPVARPEKTAGEQKSLLADFFDRDHVVKVSANRALCLLPICLFIDFSVL